MGEAMDHPSLHVAPTNWQAIDIEVPKVCMDDVTKLTPYLKKIILYHYIHAVKMFEGWQAEYADVKSMYPEPNSNARIAIWQKITNPCGPMGSQRTVMKAIEDDIIWTCDRIISDLEGRGMCTPYRNLQRRSEYFLRLCISAMTDLRLMDQCSTVLFGPDHGTIHKKCNIGYASGLGLHEKDYVCTLLLYAPYMYDKHAPGRHRRIKLPLHFVEVYKLWTGECSVKSNPRILMAGLMRYCRFLVYLICDPFFYDAVFWETWKKPRVLGFGDLPTLDDIEDVDQNQMISILKEFYRDDVDSVITKDTDLLPPKWTNEMPGVHSNDLTQPPLTRDQFEDFMTYDRFMDISACEETMDNIWSRVMRDC